MAGDDVPLEGGRVPQRRPAADGDAVLQERLVQRRTPRGIRLSTGTICRESRLGTIPGIEIARNRLFSYILKNLNQIQNHILRNH